MNHYWQLLEAVEKEVQARFKITGHTELRYHNISHTCRVVSAATQIANHYGLGDTEVFIIIAAAWFHDIGYLKKAGGHEELSAREAVDFLTSLHVDRYLIDAISSCILATSMPQHPKNLCEQILCDADLFHLATDRFLDDYKELRKEYELLYQTITEEEWKAKTLAMMQAHQYFTDYCRQLLTTEKEENRKSFLYKNDIKE